MGIFKKIFKEPEIDMEKSNTNAKKMRTLFNQVVEDGDNYSLIFGYTEDVRRFNYGFVHGSKTKIGNLIVGWNADTQTIVVVPTVPDLSGCGIQHITVVIKYTQHIETNILPTLLLFTRIKKDISGSMHTIGLKMNHFMYMYLKKVN